ncbi:MAG: hypothetical protein O6702_02155, partial [Candidatus Dadabacteria bacterium]|nr:hypothetical protein [Candidatus Dadabacteria bacterium]
IINNVRCLLVEKLCRAESLFETELSSECFFGGTKRICGVETLSGRKGTWDCWTGGDKIDCILGVEKECPELFEEPDMPSLK